MYVVSKVQETHQVFKRPSNKCKKPVLKLRESEHSGNSIAFKLQFDKANQNKTSIPL
jgi:hypothetical protein